jgi:nicotinate-nucleotide adenylyltransferase
MKVKSKVGIYAGSFDPVHLGHITFALQAIEESKLDKVYFLPERNPRDKSTHEHFGHRVAMIKRAIRPHRKLALLELDDRTFSVRKTLPKLEKLFSGRQLVFLFGSDKVAGLIDWPDAEKLLDSSEVIVGLRQSSSTQQISQDTAVWPKPPIKVIASYWPAVVSTEIRRSLQRGQAANGLVKSVASYIRQNWLYVSLR